MPNTCMAVGVAESDGAQIFMALTVDFVFDLRFSFPPWQYIHHTCYKCTHHCKIWAISLTHICSLGWIGLLRYPSQELNKPLALCLGLIGPVSKAKSPVKEPVSPICIRTCS